MRQSLLWNLLSNGCWETDRTFRTIVVIATLQPSSHHAYNNMMVGFFFFIIAGTPSLALSSCGRAHNPYYNIVVAINGTGTRRLSEMDWGITIHSKTKRRMVRFFFFFLIKVGTIKKKCRARWLGYVVVFRDTSEKTQN